MSTTDDPGAGQQNGKSAPRSSEGHPEQLIKPILSWPYAEDVLLDTLAPELIESHAYAQLGRALNLRRVVCIVGSGVNIAYGMTSWSEFLEVVGGVLKDKLNQAKIKAEDKQLDGAPRPLDATDLYRARSRYEILQQNLADVGVDLSATPRAVVADAGKMNLPVVLELAERLHIELDRFLDPAISEAESKKAFRAILKRLLGDMLGSAEHVLRDIRHQAMNARSDGTSPSTPFLDFAIKVLGDRPAYSRRDVIPISAIDSLPALFAMRILSYRTWTRAGPGGDAADQSRNLELFAGGGSAAYGENMQLFAGMSVAGFKAALAKAIQLENRPDGKKRRPRTGAELEEEERTKAEYLNHILRQPALSFMRSMLIDLLLAQKGVWDGSELPVETIIKDALIETVRDGGSVEAGTVLRDLLLRTAAEYTQDKPEQKKAYDDLIALDRELQRLLDDRKKQEKTSPPYPYEPRRQRRAVIPRHRDPLSVLYDTLQIQRFVTTNYDTEIERLLATRGYRISQDDADRMAESGDPILSVRAIDWLGAPAQDFVLGRKNAADLIEFATQGRAESIQVFHIHGRATDDTEIIVTERDYRDHYLSGRHARDLTDEALRLVFASNPLLFVGVGMKEDDVLRPLRTFMSLNLTLTERPAIAFLPAAQEKAKRSARAMELMSRYGVYTVHYGVAEAAETNEKGEPCERLASWQAGSAVAGDTGPRIWAPREALQVITTRCDDLIKLLELKEERQKEDDGQVRMDQYHQIQVLEAKIAPSLPRLKSLHGRPSGYYPLDVELEVLEVVRDQILADKVVHLGVARELVKGVRGGLATPFLCAALHELREKWLDWRRDWAHLPAPRSGSTNDRRPATAYPQSDESPEESPVAKQAHRHAIRLRDLEIEAFRAPDPLPAATSGAPAEEPITLDQLVQDPPAPTTDRFFAAAPSPSFQSLREALRQGLHAPSFGGRFFVFLADRGLGKGQFFAAMRSPRRFAQLCEWLGLVDPPPAPAEDDRPESNHDALQRTSHVYRAFLNLGFSNEVVSIFDRIADFLAEAAADITEDSTQVRNALETVQTNRIARLEMALRFLSEGRRKSGQEDARVVIAINHTNIFFETDGRPKNAQVLLLFNLLLDERWKRAPIDYLFFVNDTLIPQSFRTPKISELSWASDRRTDLSTASPPEPVAFTPLIPPDAEPDEKIAILERFKAVGLRTLAAGARKPEPDENSKVIPRWRGFYAHALRETRAEVFSIRFFPLAAEALARRALLDYKHPDRAEVPPDVETRAYRRFARERLSEPSQVWRGLRELQRFQAEVRDHFEKTLQSGGQRPFAARLDEILANAVGLGLLGQIADQYVAGPSTDPSGVDGASLVAAVRKGFVNPAMATREAVESSLDDIRLASLETIFPKTQNTPGEIHPEFALGYLQHSRRQFEQLRQITGGSRFAMTLLFAAISDIYESALRGAHPAYAGSTADVGGGSAIGRLPETYEKAVRSADITFRDLYNAVRLATAGRRPEACEDVIIGELLGFYDRFYSSKPIWPIAPSLARSGLVKLRGAVVDGTEPAPALDPEAPKSANQIDGALCVTHRMSPHDWRQVLETAEYLGGRFAELSNEPFFLACCRSFAAIDPGHERNFNLDAFRKHPKNHKIADLEDKVSRLSDLLLLDTIVGAQLENAPGGLISNCAEAVLLALALIGQPVTPDVLMASPDVRSALERLCRASGILPLSDDRILPDRIKRLRKDVGDMRVMRLVLVKILNLQVHRCHVFRLKGKLSEFQPTPGAGEGAETGWRGVGRFAVHKSIRRHIHNMIDAPMVDYAEIDQLTFSMFATQPNELPRPNPMAHARIVKFIDALIAYEEPEVGVADAELNDEANPPSESRKARWWRQRRRRLDQLRAAYGVVRSVYSVGVVSGLNSSGGEYGGASPGFLEQHRLRVRWMLKCAVAEEKRVDPNLAKRVPPEGRQLNWNRVAPFYPEEIAWLYNECGVISLVQGKLGDAAALFERSERAVVTNLESGRAGPLHNRVALNAALCDLERGGGRNARRRFERLLGSSFEQEALKSVAHGYIALCDHLSGNTELAIHRYGEAIEQLTRLQRNRAASIFAGHLANLYMSRLGDADLELSQKWIKEALNLAANGGHEDIRQAAIVSRTRLAMHLGVRGHGTLTARLDGVESYANAAGIPRLLCESYLLRSAIAQKGGDLHGAARSASDALELATRWDMQLRKISAMTRLGDVLMIRNQKQEANALLVRAMSMADKAQFYIARDAAERLMTGSGRNDED